MVNLKWEEASMKRNNGHTVLYKLLGISIQFFCIAFYSFLIGCILLTLFTGADVTYGLLLRGLLLFGQGGFVILCGIAIVSIAESI